MLRLGSISRVYHTLRHLRTRQITHQVLNRLRQPRLASGLIRPAARAAVLNLVAPIGRFQSYIGVGEFRFLNQQHNLGDPINWTATELPLLWRYNLHYFDYLHQAGIFSETGFSLMREWATRHPPLQGAVGWQPYPLSLRIVNWLKFMNTHQEFDDELVQSLSLQTENLARQIEYHLFGNHLFANGKALWFAGAFLNRAEWLRLGKKILLEQLDEQFLPDGGHFELSPMYHALAVEDLLDLINLVSALQDYESLDALQKVTERALSWLEGIIDAQHNIPLLNDSVHGIASPYDQLRTYAERLGLRSFAPCSAVSRDFGWNETDLSGYRVLNNGVLRVIFDTAPLGPDYLLGHAHCDMLSVLLDFKGQSVLTDTGVVEYAESPRRAYSRSTAAHNTVTLDGLEQGDIWKSFRMGKRGRPANLQVSASEISCEHTGFEQWQKTLKHQRTLKLLKHGFELLDTVRGRGKHFFCSRFHFAPGIVVTRAGGDRYCAASNLFFEVFGCDSQITTSEYYPQFGVTEERTCLVLSGTFREVRQFGLRCSYTS